MNALLFNPRSVFIIGFSLGFAISILFITFEQIFEPPFCQSLWKNGPEFRGGKERTVEFPGYQEWRKNQQVIVSPFEKDSFVHDAKNKNNVVLESEWSSNNTSITCIVFVEKLKLALSIKGSWGKKCNKLFFFSRHLNDLSVPVLNLGFKYNSSWQLLCEAMNYVWKKTEGSLSWVIFVKDDTFTIFENLRYMLKPLDYTKPHYLGHPVILWGIAYNIAQAGFVLSSEAFRRIIETFNSSEKCLTGGKFWKKEDYYLGKHLASMKIYPGDTRDSLLRATFHGYTLPVLLTRAILPDSYWSKALYPCGDECCSPRSVTFSAGEPDKMWTFDYLLHHLYVYKYGTLTDLPPTPLMPVNEVWKFVLREEFNMSNVDGITNQKYTDIWKAKYSSPEEFLEKSVKRRGNV